ncbi:MAG: error-prone DNA polymerase, partial [Pseudomonadota bacterium]
REHGVEIRPVCINQSEWDNAMEADGKGGLALRLGFRQVKSLSEEDSYWIVVARANDYRSVEDVWRRAGLPPKTLTILAEADMFRSIGLSRREALWQARAIKGTHPLPLFARDLDGEGHMENPITLPQMSEGEEIVEDFVSMRLTLRRHPVALLRSKLTPPIIAST